MIFHYIVVMWGLLDLQEHNKIESDTILPHHTIKTFRTLKMFLNLTYSTKHK